MFTMRTAFSPATKQSIARLRMAVTKIEMEGQEAIPISAAPPSPVISLAESVIQLESIRDVKDLQRHYAQLLTVGQVDAATELFTPDAVFEWGETRYEGRSGIRAWLHEDDETWSGLHVELIDQPLVTLAGDGRTAKGRWHGKRFLGDGAGRAIAEAGIFENEYRLGDGGWLISRLRFVPFYRGDHATGWTNVDSVGVPLVPRHFTPDDAGAPVPMAPVITAPGADHDELAARIERLNAEDDVRNLQHALGYYTDRRMWTDVEDLLEESARIRFDRTDHPTARAALESLGPEGLTEGVLHDRVLFDVVVDVAPGADTARAQGIELGLLGDARTGMAAWEFSVFTNDFVRRQGIWRVSGVDVTRMLHADHRDGWGGRLDSRPDERGWVPCLSPRLPAAVPAPAESTADAIPLDDLVRRLARSRAYDGAENVSAAYGYYLDDFQWPEMAALFAVDGHKQSPFAGYYLGRDRILEAAGSSHGQPKAPDARRERLVTHWRPQHVITVSHDGRSANIRTRLFQTRTAATVLPDWTGIHSGSYPNDQAVLEDGVWRLWSVTIDEYYFTSPTWQGGWSAARRRPEGETPPPSRLLTVCPPDIPLSALGVRAEGFRGGPGRTIEWPEIVPMWFHYRNPVSGRIPDHYWPDCVPSAVNPSASMTYHGYQMPPTGPSVDGLDLAQDGESITHSRSTASRANGGW